MSNAIRVEGLGKRYQLGAGSGDRHLREVVVDRLRRVRREPQVDRRELWALEDVSFSVPTGSAVGIIGANGAGKSTLLKILSRVTRPSTGFAEIAGSVGALLEVGTGFHPELTGRENVFLSGSILGMRRSRIIEAFDEIVEFSGVGAFLDTPIKRYSSGMRVRLGFAVAAHLEPDVLIVDEVLAVGDAAFQRKCLGKMSGTASSGRTVLFVSHSMGAVQQLCPTSLWLEAGRVRAVGPTGEVVGQYLRSTEQGTGQGVIRPLDPAKEFQLVGAEVVREDEQPAEVFSCDEPVLVDLTFQSRAPVAGLYGYLDIRRPDGTVVLVSDSRDLGGNPVDRMPAGQHRLRLRVPARTLGAGEYRIYCNFTSDQSDAGFHVDSPGIVAAFTLTDDATFRGDARGGVFSTLLAWEPLADGVGGS